MDSAIDAGIETIKAINALITNLRGTPDLIQRISSKSQQLNILLGALHRKSHTLSDADMKDWLEHQRICNTPTLRQIKNLLEDYAKGTQGKAPILVVAKFQFGPKQALSGLMEDLEKNVQFFVSFAKLVRSSSQVMQSRQRHHSQSSRTQEPVMSLCQFVQMQLEEEEEEEEEEAAADL